MGQNKWNGWDTQHMTLATSLEMGAGYIHGGSLYYFLNFFGLKFSYVRVLKKRCEQRY